MIRIDSVENKSLKLQCGEDAATFVVVHAAKRHKDPKSERFES